MEFANRQGLAVQTFNRLHFVRLHRSPNGKHAGIVVGSEAHDTTALAQRID
jgi:hypothetical protein